jgi:anti-anti-sigma regulatory factor
MSTPLVLPAEMTIYVAAELRTPWLAWLDGAPATPPRRAVDGQAVEEVDAAGLQCLLALARSLDARQQRLRLDQPSEALRLACLRLGAQHLLAEPEGAAA